MNFVINVVLLLGGIVMAGIGFALARSNPVGWAVAALGVGMVVLAFKLDKNRVKQRDVRVADEINNRIATLTRRPWMQHEQFQVPQSGAQVASLLLVFLLGGGGVWLGLHATSTNWLLVLGSMFLLGIVALSSPVVLAGIGKPALVLDRFGFQTPVDGLIAWRHVEGIYLQVVTYRGVKNYSLVFKVPEYAKAVSSIHWSQRLLAMFGLGGLRRGSVSVSIKGGKDQPETIEAVARHLWHSETGRDYIWSPHLSQEANAACQRMAQLRAKVDEHGGLEEALRANPELALADMKRFTRDMTLINNEVSKKSRVANWLTIVSIVGMALALAWPWLKNW